MRIGDEHDLHEQLDRAFGAVTAGAAPVDRAVRQGKAIKLRRHVAVAAGAAAVVAACAVAISSLPHPTSSATAVSGEFTMTVQAPGPHAPVGEIALGTVNGQRYQVVAAKPGTAGAGPGRQRISASGPAFGAHAVSASVPALIVAGTDPVTFRGFTVNLIQCKFGAVRPDVSYVTITLANGTVLTLHPVTVYGIRAVAFAVPVGPGIVRATAFLRDGGIAASTASTRPGGMASFGPWRPGT